MQLGLPEHREEFRNSILEKIRKYVESFKKKTPMQKFIKSLPFLMESETALFRHSILNEYLLPRDVESPEKIQRLFNALGAFEVCFVGHSHIPGVFTEDCHFYSPAELNCSFNLDSYKGKKIIDVGSVGNPRDKNNKACYVIWQNRQVSWIRLSYDYHVTIKKIVTHIEESCGHYAERLERGI